MLLSIRLSMLWKILPMDNRIGLSRKGLGVVAASRAWTGYTEEKDPFLFVFRARISRNNKVNGKKKRKKKKKEKEFETCHPGKQVPTSFAIKGTMQTTGLESILHRTR